MKITSWDSLHHLDRLHQHSQGSLTKWHLLTTMSCEVASPTSSPHPDSLFEDDWKRIIRDSGGLGAIAEFNANFNNHETGGNGYGIDPQLLSEVSSPDSNYVPLFNTVDDSDSPATTTEHTAPIEMPNAYPAPTDSNLASPGSAPYFHQSIEIPEPTFQPPAYIPSPLRHQLHRRSVSEPPGGNPSYGMHSYPAHGGPAVTFHREGILLGTPAPQHSTRSTTKPKTRHPHLQQPYSTTKRQTRERYQLRRTHTQPEAAPTSVPAFHGPQQHPMTQPTMPTVPFAGSRTCTPVQSPIQEDILASPVHMGPNRGSAPPERKRAVAIPVSMEELRAMITEAVQMVFAGAESVGCQGR